jgi:hypothetical protein
MEIDKMIIFIILLAISVSLNGTMAYLLYKAYRKHLNNNIEKIMLYAMFKKEKSNEDPKEH